MISAFSSFIFALTALNLALAFFSFHSDFPMMKSLYSLPSFLASNKFCALNVAIFSSAPAAKTAKNRAAKKSAKSLFAANFLSRFQSPTGRNFA